MRILLSGSSGFIGSALSQHLHSEGNSIVPLVRKSAGPGQVQWSPETGLTTQEDFDAVIHLAGENINGFWTQAKKKKIYSSRVYGTRMLVQSLLHCKKLPEYFICASAMGYYGDRQEEILTESSGPGKGFLADVCSAWEEAAYPLKARGVKVVHLRTSVVLDPTGGALQKMAFAYRLGLGGRMGSGEQYISWISLEDYVRAVSFILEKQLEGPLNLSTPEPVRQIDFARILASVLEKPCFLSLPEWAIRLFLGEMGRSLLLGSTRMIPEALIESGFTFHHIRLEETLRNLFFPIRGK